MLKSADSTKYQCSSETKNLQAASNVALGPTPKPISLAALTAIFASGNFISTFFRMAGGILTARVVEPAVLGLFNGMGLVLGYVPFLQLGILNGLNRELPYYVGKGDNDLVRDLAAAAQAWALLVGGVVALGLLGVSGWQLWEGKFSLALGWATYAVGALVLFYGQYYLQITYRTRHDFARLAAINMTQEGAALLLVVLVWWLSFYGLCLRSLAVGGVFLVLLWHWRPLKVAPRWDRAHLWHLLKVGAPIFAVGQLYTWWAVVNSTLVLHYLGVKGLGLYALALMVERSLQMLPEAMSQICYPRMAEEYGRTGQVADLFRIVQRPTFWLTLGMVPLVLLSWLIFPSLANFLLPKYAEGVPAAQWAMISAGLMSLAPAFNAFNVVKRQDLYGFAILMGIVTYIAMLMWLVHPGAYLAAFSQAMLAGKVVFLLFCGAFLYYLLRQEHLLRQE